MSHSPTPEPPTAPIWYEGDTPWSMLSRGMKLYESVQGGTLGALLETLDELDLMLGPPIEQALPTLIAVLEYAGRDREESELAGAVRWLQQREVLRLVAPIALPAT